MDDYEIPRMPDWEAEKALELTREEFYALYGPGQ